MVQPYNGAQRWFYSFKRLRLINYMVRDIVKAAHLQPLEKKDLETVKADQPWNTCTAKDDKSLNSQATTLALPKKPRNCQEFLREWRQLDTNITAKNR